MDARDTRSEDTPTMRSSTFRILAALAVQGLLVGCGAPLGATMVGVVVVVGWGVAFRAAMVGVVVAVAFLGMNGNNIVRMFHCSLIWSENWDVTEHVQRSVSFSIPCGTSFDSDCPC